MIQHEVNPLQMLQQIQQQLEGLAMLPHITLMELLMNFV